MATKLKDVRQHHAPKAEERIRQAVLAAPPGEDAERARRRSQAQRAIRLNLSEGLEPTVRLLELHERYIAGEITLEEFSEIVRSW